jgi:hypothetical protein
MGSKVDLAPFFWVVNSEDEYDEILEQNFGIEIDS